MTKSLSRTLLGLLSFLPTTRSPADAASRKLKHLEQTALQLQAAMLATPAVAAMHHDSFDQRPDRIA